MSMDMGMDTVQDDIVRFVANDDVESIRMLLARIKCLPEKKGRRASFELLDAMLKKDKVALAAQFFDWNTIAGWCAGKCSYMMKSCPKLFAAWVCDESFPAIAIELQKNTSQKKLNLLHGLNLTVQEQVVHQLIKDKPERLSYFDVSWVGKHGSDLRKAAESLGWNRTIFATQMYGQYSNISSFGTVIAYPYSAIAATLCYQRENDKGINQLWRCVALVEQGATDKKARPKDMALAKLLIEHARPGETLTKNPDVPDIYNTDKVYLQSIVSMHAGLNSFDLLFEQLVHDTFDTYSVIQEFDLPNLDGH